MDTPDDIRTNLNDAASSIDVGDLDVARTEVDGLMHRRRTRTRLGAGIGVLALVVGGAVVVTSLADSDEPDTLVSATPTVVDSPDATTPTSVAPDPTDGSTAGSGNVQVLDRPGVVGAAFGTNGAPQYGEWVAPWKDGFLVGSTSFPPQPLPAELPEEVRALFPQEVLDLFDGGLPATINEATAMLSDAGLLDVVSKIISENPAASEAIYGTPVTEDPTVDVRFTTDGNTWEPVEMTLPPGAYYVPGIASDGDRLAIAYAAQDDPTTMANSDTVTIATTNDLTTWTTQEIVMSGPGIELPPEINRSVSPQGLVANSQGWALAVYQSTDPDVMALLPDDIRAEVEADTENGFSVGYGTDGVTIEYGFDGSVQPATTLDYSWEELGIAPDVVEYLRSNEFSPEVWAASWDGVPTRSETNTSSGQLIATPAGFLQWTDQTLFSPDGLSWAASPLPDPDGQVNAAFAFDGGVIAVSTDEAGMSQFYRLDETGGSPVPIEVPELPGRFQVGFGSNWAPGSALIVDAADMGPAPEPIVLDQDGYRLTIGQGTYELTEIATGSVLASEDFRFAQPGGESAFQFDSDELTVVDLATGDPIVTIPSDVIEAAYRASQPDLPDQEDYSPAFWLIASNDGERFVVQALPGGAQEYGPTAVTTNGNTVLTQSGEQWVTYDLS